MGPAKIIESLPILTIPPQTNFMPNARQRALSNEGLFLFSIVFSNGFPWGKKLIASTQRHESTKRKRNSGRIRECEADLEAIDFFLPLLFKLQRNALAFIRMENWRQIVQHQSRVVALQSALSSN